MHGLALLTVLPALALAQQSPDSAAMAKSRGDLPLETERTIEFTVDEGTWLSLDVAPDGESIVFEILGDLYRIPFAGGDATRLTWGTPYDTQPRLSPDGEWMAFISDRDGSDNLWVAKADGTEPRKLSSERQNAMISPSWTPDSRYVIVTRRGRQTELRMHHVNGGSGLTIGQSGDTPAAAAGAPGGGGSRPAELGASMSPDGRYLYFARAGGAARGRFPMWQIARRDMQTGDVDVLTQAGGSGIRPQVSPDGTLLVYGTRHETQTGLRIRTLETGADEWLVYPIQRDEQESGGAPSRDLLPSFAFTPDGSGVVYTNGGKIAHVDIATGATREIPFSADVTLDVGPELAAPYRVPQGSVRATLVQDPTLSPDGSRMAFSVLTKLYVMDDPDGEPTRLTDGDAWEFKPTWSPDGEWIAYVTWDMDGGHVWKTRADGRGDPIRLTRHEAFYTDLVFSPDGERIVGLRGNAYQRHQTFSEFGGLRIPLDLVWMDADGGDGSDGGDVHLVVPARGVGAPHFAGDPDRIYVYANSGLISLRYDGTDRRTHLRVTGPANPRSPRPPAAQTVLMRPGGGWALAAVNNQLWVVAVPVVGGGPPTVSVRGPAVPAKRITDIGADYFSWADDGETIVWAIGSTVYRRPFSSIDFTPEDRTASRDGAGADSAAAPAAAGADSAAVSDSAGAAASDSASATKDPLDADSSVVAREIVMEFPRNTPSGSVVLRGATVIPMSGQATLPNHDIVVTDNRIAAIGPHGTVNMPEGAREIDVSGRYVIPGLIDTHAHWEFRTHDVLEPQNWSLVANLAYGVTAGLDVQTATNDYFAYRDLVETGQALGQRAFMTGPGVFSANDFQSYEATLSYLKRYKEHYRTPNIKSYMVGNRKQRQWVVKASAELGLMPTTEGGRDLKLDLTHSIDGFHGNEHTLPVTPLFDDVVQLYSRMKTAYTPTLLVLYGGVIAEEYFYATTEVHDDPKLNRFYPHNQLDAMSQRRGIWLRDAEQSFDDAAAQAAKIQRAGGLVGVGGHGQLQGLGYHWEMWALAMGGMTPMEVLQAATIDGARIIGIEQDLGTLEVGKLADLVVLTENPLENIRNTTSIQYVMKNGEMWDGDTLDQIWPVAKPLPEFWWWGETVGR